jgi:hypothetical protein
MQLKGWKRSHHFGFHSRTLTSASSYSAGLLQVIPSFRVDRRVIFGFGDPFHKSDPFPAEQGRQAEYP